MVKRWKKVLLSTLISVLLLFAMFQVMPMKSEMTKTVEAVGSSDFIYLSDLGWEHIFSADDATREVYGMEAAPSVWKDQNMWGGPIRLHGVPYEKGLYITGLTSLSYRLNGSCTVFEADLGADTDAYNWIGLDVYGDNVLLYSSPEIYADTPTLQIRVPISGVNLLKLNVMAPWMIHSCVLADAKLYYNLPLEAEQYYLLQPDEWFIEMRRPVDVWTQNESMKVTVMSGAAATQVPLLKCEFWSPELLVVGQTPVGMKTVGQNVVGEVDVALPELNGVYNATFELEYQGNIVASKEFVFGVVPERTSNANEDSIFGNNAAFYLYSGFRESKYMAQIGIKWTRYWFAWLAIEPTNNTFDFSLGDESIGEIRAANLSIVGLLGWSIPSWESATLGGYPPRENDWVDYVHHVVERYKDEIKVWEFWNEPGLGTWNYTYYEKLLKVTYQTIKAIDPEAKLIHGLNVPECGSGWVNNEVIFRDGFGDYFDGLVRHPYRMPYAPEDEVANYAPTPDSTTTFKEEIMNDYALIQKYGGGKEMWYTEIGWMGPGVGWTGNTMQEQSDYLERTYVLALSTGLEPKVFYQGFGTSNNIGALVNGAYPYPDLVAYANVANQLEEAKYVKTLNLSDGNIYACMFEASSTDVYALWTAKQDRWISVTEDIGKVTVIDGFGNPCPTVKQANQFSVLLQGSPVFMRAEKGSSLNLQVATAPPSSKEQNRGYETNLADGFRSLKSIIINSSTIYVAEDMVNGSIYSFTLDGNDEKVLAKNLKLPDELAMDSKSLYCGGYGAYKDLYGWQWGELKKITLATGQIIDLDLSGQYLGGVYSIAVSPSYIYYVCDSVGVPVRVPTNGGPIEYLDNGTLKDNQFVSTYGSGLLPTPLAILATESNLYWSGRGDIYTRPTADNGLTTKLASESVSYTPSMVMDSQYIYFVNTIEGFVRKVPLTGGNAATLAQGLDYPNNVAVDDEYVYWSELGLNSGGGSIKRIPKNGGPTTTLIDGLGEVGGLALDKDYVYWTEGGSLNKIAKDATAPMFLPFMSTNRTETLLGHAIAITGQLNSPVNVSNVTLQYSLDNGKTWSLLTELSTDASGRFSYNWKPLEAGEYLVRAVWQPGIRYQEVMVESVLTVAAGDLNLDGVVNIVDVTIVARAYMNKPGDPNWNAIADVDKNGIVNILDIAIVARNFGKKA